MSDRDGESRAHEIAVLKDRLQRLEEAEAIQSGQVVEYLPPTRPEVQRRHRRLIRVAATAAAFFVLLVCLDWRVRVSEMTALVTATEASERSMESANSALMQADDDYATATQPDTYSASNQEAALSRLSSAARTGQSDVLNTGDAVAEVRILPWHSAIRLAQRRYLAHSRAWQRYLAE
jgi:hypothetical protein